MTYHIESLGNINTVFCSSNSLEVDEQKSNKVFSVDKRCLKPNLIKEIIFFQNTRIRFFITFQNTFEIHGINDIGM